MHPQDNSKFSERRAFIGWLLAGVALIVITRLPQFLGGRMSADADECVVGLMAKHMLEGRDFPIFFYGQKYGLTFFEAGTAAIFFKFFGVSTAPMKAAMLVLWSVGTLFLALSVKRMAGGAAAIATMIFWIICPAWLAWSMKARGGYLTAFAAAHIAIWLLARPRDKTDSARAACLGFGVCAGIIFFAQPVWLTVLPSFVLLLVYRRQRVDDLVFMALGALVSTCVILAVSSGAPAAVWHPPLLQNPGGLEAVRELPWRLWTHLSGAYYLRDTFPLSPATFAATFFWYAAVLAALAHVAGAALRHESYDAAQACTLAILGPALFSVLINRDYYMFRYLLPVAPCLAMLLGITFAEVSRMNGKPRQVAVEMAGLLLVISIAAVVDSGRFSYDGSTRQSGPPKDETVRALADDLEEHNVKHVYSADAFLQWHLMFVSREAVLARWISPVDRYPAYGMEVDRALRAGEKVAIVGEARDLIPFLNRMARHHGRRRDLKIVAGRYYVLYDATIDEVRDLISAEIKN